MTLHPTTPTQAAIAALAQAARTLPREVFLVQAARFNAAYPNDFTAQDLLGALYASLGRFDLAEPAFGKALAARPGADETRLVHGVTLFELGRYEDACRCLAMLAGMAEAEMYLGLALQGLERFEDAVQHLQAAVRHEPGNVRALNNLGACFMALRRYDEAEGALQRALQLAPAYDEAVLNLADVWNARADQARSLALIDRHLARAPRNANLHAKRGDALFRNGMPAEAIRAYECALALAPDQADFHAALGKAWHGLGDLDAALACLERAIVLAPDSPVHRTDLGIALEEAGNRQEAIAALDRALALDPRDDFIRSRLYGCKMQACDWQGLAALLPNASEFGAGDHPVSPFALLTHEHDPAAQLKRARRFARKFEAIRAAPLAVPPAPDGRIRVGYFSADFHDHATMLLMSGLFRLHDRNRFAITAYSFGPPHEDTVRAALIRDVERFVDVYQVDNAAIIAQARCDGLDIAVDLKGYTRHNRTELFAHRLAPIQVNWLGYPGTCGTGFHDYLVGDSVTTPPEAQPHYTEQLIRLAGSYQCNDDTRPIANWRPSRAELNLPDRGHEGGFVFCCFNNLYKITPEIFAIWIRLLHAVPGSVLWLLRSNRDAEHNLRTSAAKAGIDPARLIFAERENNPRHLARMALADLFLDTFPYNAHTTASDALWAGLPLITLMGETFPSRVAASLLENCGLPDLITRNEAEYEAAALALARAPNMLLGIRTRLASRANLSLFDTARFTRDIEGAWSAVHRRQLEGLPPAPLTLT
jgi:tetratricopeptide (TPR) repeat protein